MSTRSFDRFIKKYGVPLAIILGALFLSGSVYISFGIPNNKIAGVTKVAPPPSPEPAPSDIVVDVSADDDPVLGNADAPVTIIEFSDFQCPFCRKFWRESFHQLKTDYIDTGKVKFVYRDFPLPFHPSSEVAAEAGACAFEQGKFWEFQDEVYGEQDKQGEATITFELKDLKNWVKNIGVDEKQFSDCLASGKYAVEVQKDLTDGTTAEVTGTPTFFVNGKPVVGAVPYEDMKQIIDAALAN